MISAAGHVRGHMRVICLICVYPKKKNRKPVCFLLRFIKACPWGAFACRGLKAQLF